MQGSNSNRHRPDQESETLQQEQEVLWKKEDLIRLKVKLSAQINSTQDVDYLVQYIQSVNLSKEIINEIMNCEFKSFGEFQQLINIYCERNNTIIYNQQQEIESLDMNCEWYQQIQELFTEFCTLNERSNQDLQKLFFLLYNDLQNIQILQQVLQQDIEQVLQQDLEQDLQQDLQQNFDQNAQQNAKQQIKQIIQENIQQIIQYRSLQYIKQNQNQDVKQNQSKDIGIKESPLLEYGDLMVLCIKVKEHFSYYPRPVQLLSAIELYNHNYNKGRLAQIYTGEGKTLIVAMLAVLLCKKKKTNVDIVTSSPVLAIRDAQELSPFYKLFQISVSHNILISNQREKNDPYDCQIIYGDTHSFQADILKHEYSELGTMGNRQQGYAIIDEVDSMLIDGNSNKTILTSPTPGMNDLSKVLRLIWDEICKVEPNLLRGKKVWIRSREQDANLTVDLDEYIEKTIDIQLRDTLKNFLPQFRLNYINFMKKFWIESAIQAKFHLHQNDNYKIDNNNVRIIDYQNTGVVHKENMQWEKGLHQFLQMKHNVSVNALRISTNYLSNISFFKRYKSRLLGLTGTLGSNITQELLAKQYNLDFLFMPPYKKSLLQKVPGIASQCEEDWLDEILKEVKQQINKGRAILIINQTINDVNKIEQHLQKSNLNYTTYVDDSQEIIRNIGPKTIIIATNLAGRGTDLNTNEELEKNGGLHVIMSFLPRNIRIQCQGFGRTARQGKKGTAQLIVNQNKNLYCGSMLGIETIQDAITYFENNSNQQIYTTLDVLNFFRHKNEQDYINEIEQDMEKLLNEDRCFQKFCKIAKRMVNNDIKKNNAEFKALEEKWGLYLEQFQDVGLNENEIEQLLISEEQINYKYLLLSGLEHDDLGKINRAAQIQNNDLYLQYYKGVYEIKNKNYQNGLNSLAKSKQLTLNKIEDEKGLATASKLNRVQVDQFQDNKKLPDIQIADTQNDSQNFILPNLDLNRQAEIQNIPVIPLGIQQQDIFDLKLNNQIKVYQKIINNINEIENTVQNFNPNEEELQLTWQNVIDQQEKDNADQQQNIKDQEEVMQDGPLPMLCKAIKLKKEKKKRKWWQYIAMFLLGIGQFLIGCAICSFTCGLAMPIGINLITQGLSDMILAVTSAWQGVDIDWGQWGMKKVVTIAATLALAGPAAIEEAFSLGASAWKSLENIGLNQFLQQIPSVTADGLAKAGFWLTDLQKNYILAQYDILKLISQVACNTTNYQNILSQSKSIIQNSINKVIITSKTANHINHVVDQSLEQSQGSVNEFKNTFYQNSQKYIRFKIAECKSQEDNSQIKDNMIQICYKEGNKQYNNIKQDIEQYDNYKQVLENELNLCSEIIMDIYQKDLEIQKQITTLDLYYERICNPKKVLEAINNKTIQWYISQCFSANDKSFQRECRNLKLTDPASITKFYNNVIRPPIQQFCTETIKQSGYKEPLQIIFQEEYQNLQDFHLQQMRLFQYKQFAQDMISHMNTRNIIDKDGITLSQSFMQEFNTYLNRQNYENNIKKCIQKAMENSLLFIREYKQQSKNILSSKLSLVIQVQMIDEMQNYIYQYLLQDADGKIMKKMK